MNSKLVICVVIFAALAVLLSLHYGVIIINTNVIKELMWPIIIWVTSVLGSVLLAVILT
jgi:uncharacterized membrane protein (Fun14 family)